MEKKAGIKLHGLNRNLRRCPTWDRGRPARNMETFQQHGPTLPTAGETPAVPGLMEPSCSKRSFHPQRPERTKVRPLPELRVGRRARTSGFLVVGGVVEIPQ